jgi:two-component system LytT family sensor kinase
VSTQLQAPAPVLAAAVPATEAGTRGGAADAGLSLGRLWGIAFVAATAIGLVFGAQAVVASLVRDREPDVAATLALQLVPWYGWALLVPFIVRLCERVPIRAERWGRGAALYAGAAALLTLAHTALIAPPTVWIGDPPWDRRPLWIAFEHLVLNRAAVDLLSVCLLVAVCYALLYHRGLRARELAASTLSAQLAEAELHALKMQVQPHFLFNTLNAIAAHVRDEPEVAEAMVERLSELLRLVLHRGREHEATLGSELELVGHYLAIHEVRYGGRLAVRLSVPAKLEGAMLPSMLLQPLVENAVAYGVARHSGPAWITVTASSEGEEDARALVLRIGNSRGSGAARAGGDGSGIGLSNTRARLRQMYGDAGRLELVPEDGAFHVVVTVPFRTAGRLTPSAEHA